MGLAPTTTSSVAARAPASLPRRPSLLETQTGGKGSAARPPTRNGTRTRLPAGSHSCWSQATRSHGNLKTTPENWAPTVTPQ